MTTSGSHQLFSKLAIEDCVRAAVAGYDKDSSVSEKFRRAHGASEFSRSKSSS